MSTFDNRETIGLCAEPVHCGKSIRVVIIIRRSILDQFQRFFTPSAMIQLLGKQFHVILLSHFLSDSLTSEHVLLPAQDLDRVII